jgi:hypothetical protein
MERDADSIPSGGSHSNTFALYSPPCLRSVYNLRRMRYWQLLIAFLAGIPVGPLFSKALDVALQRHQQRVERTRNAARELYEATWQLQEAGWEFYTLYVPPAGVLVARAAADVIHDEEKIIQKFNSAIQALRRDYDWPSQLAEAVKQEIETINIEFANLSAFAMSGQHVELEQAARNLEVACDRIRGVARTYTTG